jgi:putative peptide zinc metalloprotease protein
LFVWMYRLGVFFGIALLVNHKFNKPLGVVLMLLEIGWFIVKPVASEVHYLLTRIGFARLAWDTFALGIFAAFFLVWLIPVASQVTAPGVIIAGVEQPVYAPAPARIVSLPVKTGQSVERGTVLLRLESPELDLREKNALVDLATAKAEYMRSIATSNHQERTDVLAKHIAEAEAALTAAREEKQRLSVNSEVAGVVRDLSSEMVAGRWLNPRQVVMRIVSNRTAVVEAYVSDSQVQALQVGQAVKFYPDSRAVNVVSGSVSAIDKTGMKQIGRALLASPYGGAIPAVIDRKGNVVSKDPEYRVVIRLDDDGPVISSVARGTVRIDTDLFVVAENFVYRALSLLIRESGI